MSEDEGGSDVCGMIITCIILSVIFPPLLPIFVALWVINAFLDIF
jgi:hypothetical protein